MESYKKRFVEYQAGPFNKKHGGTASRLFQEEIFFKLKDKATHFVEVYQGKNRTGMALLFAGKNERDAPVLLVNSIELLSKLRSDQNRNRVLTETARYISDSVQKMLHAPLRAVSA